MNRIISPLFALIIFLSACASPVTPTLTPASTFTPAPVEPVEATATAQSTEVVPVENTATGTFTPEPTSTSTPVPPPARWYWAVDDSAGAQVVAVNQFGERRALGALDQSDDMHTAVVSLDHERALLFLDTNDTLRVYLLTPNGMQKIKLPSEPFYFNTELSQTSRAVIAVHAERVVFSYVTEGSSNLMPDTGPILLIDLTARTTKLIDAQVHRDAYGNTRYWFHVSQDGRILRYQNGDRDKIEIRELDMLTGEARTLFTTSGSPFNIRAAPQGELWFLKNDSLIVDLNGNKTPFTDKARTVRPLEDGKAIVLPIDCADDCTIKVITPFGNSPELVYKFPWAIVSGTYYEGMQVLPDQSLLFIGQAYLALPRPPAALDTYPSLLEEDRPLFRLTPAGQARLVGIYTGSVSADGRYILLRSSDHSSFFIYDAVADRPLFDIPIDTTLEDYMVMSTRFFDNGILVNLSASVPGRKNVYRFFYHAYVYETSASIGWEDVNAEVNACPDLLEDGTVVCWFYQTDSPTFDLIHFDPATGTKTILLENVWLVDFTP